MTTSQIQCQYLVDSGVLTPAQIAPLMAAVPIDTTIPYFYGLRLITDTTTTGSTNVERSLTYSMLPASNAAGTANMVGTGGAGGIASVTKTASGGPYTAVPVVSTSGGNPTVLASIIAICKLTGVSVLNAGSGYTAPVVSFVGGSLAPGGTVPVASATVGGGGSISAINVTTVGGPYTQAPSVVVADPTGSGCIAVANLTVDSFQVQTPGAGYSATPTIVVTPYYKVMVPNGSPLTTEQAVLASFMKPVFDKVLRMNTFAATPVVS